MKWINKIDEAIFYKITTLIFAGFLAVALYKLNQQSLQMQKMRPMTSEEDWAHSVVKDFDKLS